MDGTHLWNLDGTYNIWMEPEHTQNGWNLFMFPNPTPDTLNWSVMDITNITVLNDICENYFAGKSLLILFSTDNTLHFIVAVVPTRQLSAITGKIYPAFMFA